MAKYNIDYEDALSFSSKDLEGMKFQDLQRTVAALTREAQGRIDELERLRKDTGLESPTLLNWEESGGDRCLSVTELLSSEC